MRVEGGERVAEEEPVESEHGGEDDRGTGSPECEAPQAAAPVEGEAVAGATKQIEQRQEEDDPRHLLGTERRHRHGAEGEGVPVDVRSRFRLCSLSSVADLSLALPHR